LRQQGLSDVAREAVGTVAATTQVVVMHAEVAVLEAMAVAGSCVRKRDNGTYYTVQLLCVLHSLVSTIVLFLTQLPATVIASSTATSACITST